MIAQPSSPGSNKIRQINVIQGEYQVSNDEDAVLSTVLGSCVATCIWDPVSGAGGMNHFLVSGERYEKAESLSYGVYAMELLINALLKKGAKRERLRAKLFGGASMMQGLPDIGRQNAKFAREFLAKEGIPCENESLGGNNARRIKFWPSSGRVRMLTLSNAQSEEVEEEAPLEISSSDSSDVELF